MKRFVLFIASLLMIGILLPALRGQSVQARESKVMLPTGSASPQTELLASPSLVTLPATTARLTGTTTYSWTLVATTPYKGDVGVGYVAYCPPLTESHKQRVVISIGSLGNIGPFEEDWCDSFTDGDSWQTEARRLGFDIYFINWDDPFNYVQRNAFVVTKLIQDIQQTTGLGPEADFVVSGGSLGGLVGRYALAYLEANNQPHHADLFITSDSPLEGVYYPIGVQYLVQYFAEQWQIEQAKKERDKELNNPLARQTLIYHYETAAGSGPTYTSDYEQLFITELQGQLGDYPHADGLRRVFVAAGRGDGQPDTPLPGSTIMHWRSYKEDVGGKGRPVNSSWPPKIPVLFINAKPVTGGWQLKVTIKRKLPLIGEIEVFSRTYIFSTKVETDVVARALPNGGTGTVFQAKPLFELAGQDVDLLDENSVLKVIKAIVDKDIPQIARKAWDDNADQALRPVAREVVKRTENFLEDNPEYKYQAVQLSAAHSYDGGPGGRDDDYRILKVVKPVDDADRGTFRGGIQDEFTFIPLHSALALDSPAPGVPIDPISVGLGSGSPPQGPFDEIHYPCKKQEAGYPCQNERHTGSLGNEVIIAELNRLVAADTTIYLPLIRK